MDELANGAKSVEDIDSAMSRYSNHLEIPPSLQMEELGPN